MACKACSVKACSYHRQTCIDNVTLIVKSEEVNGTLHVENPKTGINGIIYPQLKDQE